MNLIQLIACIGLITGCFVLLHISPMDFTEGVFRRITSKPKSIRSEVNESTRRKKKSFLRREIEETQTILRMTGRAAKFPMVCALSLLLFLVGAAFALTLGNLFLVPVLAVGMMFVPFWFIRLTANHYKKNIAAELETALSRRGGNHVLKRILRSRRGEGYIDVCVLVLCAMLVIALAVQVLPAFIAKQQLDTFATELVREAEIAGRIGPETDRREQALREQTGLDPEIEWSDTGRIQLNEEVTVTLTHEIDLGLFAGFGSFPITLRADATGKSEVYWK